jgi:hypothetical protein
MRCPRCDRQIDDHDTRDWGSPKCGGCGWVELPGFEPLADVVDADEELPPADSEPSRRGDYGQPPGAMPNGHYFGRVEL